MCSTISYQPVKLTQFLLSTRTAIYSYSMCVNEMLLSVLVCSGVNVCTAWYKFRSEFDLEERTKLDPIQTAHLLTLVNVLIMIDISFDSFACYTNFSKRYCERNKSSRQRLYCALLGFIDLL